MKPDTEKIEYVRRDLMFKAYTELLEQSGDIFTTDVTDALLKVPVEEDVYKVIPAEWIVCGDGKNVPYMCSHCGKTVPAILIEYYPHKYCPNCNARMGVSV